MNLESTDILIAGLFARRVTHTIKEKEYNEKSINVLIEVKNKMKEILDGKDEITNYATSTANSLKYINAYGNAMTIIQASPELEEKEGCVETTAKGIISEINIALKQKTINPKTLPKTLEWYSKIRKYSINKGSRFNIQPSAENAWGVITKY